MGEHEISQVFGDSRRKSHDVMIYNDIINASFTFFLQKATLGALGFCTFYFCHLFFYFVFFIAKIPRFISKQKNQSCEKNLGQVHSGLFLCIFLFLFRFFVVPSPTVQKLEENQKNQKKQSCEKNLG